MDNLQVKIDDAVELWKRFWGKNLEAVALYGSAARAEWSKKSSDINLLLLLNSDDHSLWPKAAEIARRKSRKGFATPLILTRNYIKSSLDVFPIEFLDMKLFHKSLHGEDFLATLEIESEHLRLQAEREIKGKWVQFRQAALERGGETSAMRSLLMMSVPTWVSVFQALIAVDGQEVPIKKAEVMTLGAELAGVEAGLFIELMEIRRTKRSLNRSAAWNLLLRTLDQVARLARFADSLSTSQEGRE